jgi:anhydro-N-acetylmuramic acid kinase
MDYANHHFFAKPYDDNGTCASTGHIQDNLVEQALRHESYFSAPAPKSTGTDYFSPAWAQQHGLLLPEPADTLATLAELTARSIGNAINNLPVKIDECFVCGGGARNQYLLQRITAHLENTPVTSTEVLGTHPDWVEAMAFAWLAHRTLNRQNGNLPSVTNAQKFTILGGVYY